MGQDNVETLKNWYEFNWLINNIEFVIVSRETSKNNWKNLPYINKLNFIKMNLVNISSSEIRKKS